MPMPRMPGRTESGATGTGALALLLSAALAVVFSVGAARAGGAAATRARADGVADLVALAAVVDPSSGADRVARANDATLVEVTARADGDTTARIRRAGVVAAATARPSAPGSRARRGPAVGSRP